MLQLPQILYKEETYLKNPPRTLHATFLATQRTGMALFAYNKNVQTVRVKGNEQK